LTHDTLVCSVLEPRRESNSERRRHTPVHIITKYCPIVKHYFTTYEEFPVKRLIKDLTARQSCRYSTLWNMSVQNLQQEASFAQEWRHSIIRWSIS